MREDRISGYLNRHYLLLSQIAHMWDDSMVQLYNDKDLPSRTKEIEVGSVFLAGPTSRHQILECNWRCQAVSFLRGMGFKGYIYVPEPRGQEEDGDFTEKDYIHYWESDRLFRATHVAFWIPRKADELLGLNTNWEAAMFCGANLITNHLGERTLFYGWPDGAERMGLPNHYLTERGGFRRYVTLEAMCKAISESAPTRIQFI